MEKEGGRGITVDKGVCEKGTTVLGPSQLHTKGRRRKKEFLDASPPGKKREKRGKGQWSTGERRGPHHEEGGATVWSSSTQGERRPRAAPSKGEG